MPKLTLDPAKPIWREREFPRWCLLAVAVGAGVMGSLSLGRSIAAMDMWLSDFIVLWTAARTPLQQIYDAAALTAAQHRLIPADAGLRPFPYPPTFIAASRWLGQLPLAVAITAWSALGLLVFLAASARAMGAKAAGLSLFAPMLWLTLMVGQVSLLFGGVLTAALDLLCRRPVLAGMLIGTLAALKPQSVLVAPVALLAGGHRRALAAAVATGMLLCLASLAWHGSALWLQWLHSLPGFAQLVAEPRFRPQLASPGAIAAGLGVTGSAALLWSLLVGALGLVATWRVFRRTEATELRIVALVAGSILCAPYAMNYDLVTLAPVGAALLLDRQGTPLRWMLGLLAFLTPFAPVALIVMALLLLVLVKASPNAARQDVEGSGSGWMPDVDSNHD